MTAEMVPCVWELELSFMVTCPLSWAKFRVYCSVFLKPFWFRSHMCFSDKLRSRVSLLVVVSMATSPTGGEAAMVCVVETGFALFDSGF